ncbi:hypothetical protein GH714_017947 [Hevea brasiliensis]|uniref:Calcium-dependent protein kinase n=1 Tax=Hevea brasiliensis TaxID=3981 RepID=A0A6A6KPQ6_HEVBR|nr:hypothetical protein GH714_017947 [Hevea brasiliensis]
MRMFGGDPDHAHLSEHPNVVQIKGTYEDSMFVHLVMELCAGGELFDRIVAKGHYSEKEAAKLIKTIVGWWRLAIPWGLCIGILSLRISCLIPMVMMPSLRLQILGSLSSISQHYGPEVDVWSAGVILYILLSGVPPFWAETEPGIFKQILQGKIDFQSEPWPKISDNAKDLIRKMLERDPRRRISAHEVLCNPWIVDDRVAPDKPLGSAVLSRLKKFSAMNKLKKMALHADIDKSGTIEYGEFLAATLHLNKMEREENLIAAFTYFDKDGSGYITVDELQQACKDFGLDDVQLDEMIKEIDQDNDARIDYAEFTAMMRKTDDEIGRIGTMRSNLNFNLADALGVNESVNEPTTATNESVNEPTASTN